MPGTEPVQVEPQLQVGAHVGEPVVEQRRADGLEKKNSALADRADQADEEAKQLQSQQAEAGPRAACGACGDASDAHGRGPAPRGANLYVYSLMYHILV